MNNNCDKCKLFVGNVPYHCTNDEFRDCFKNIEGFIKAEIVTKYNKNMSRGFGFVTLDNEQNAKKLKDRNDIICKDRYLRMTHYDVTIDNSSHPSNTFRKNDSDDLNINYNKFTKNYIYIDGIPSDKNIDWLKNIFLTYGIIGKIFINTDIKTGISKNNGIVEIIDDLTFKKLIDLKKINIDNDICLNLSKYKHKYKYRYN